MESYKNEGRKMWINTANMKIWVGTEIEKQNKKKKTEEKNQQQ